jgi:hypothetical protein
LILIRQGLAGLAASSRAAAAAAVVEPVVDPADEASFPAAAAVVKPVMDPADDDDDDDDDDDLRGLASLKSPDELSSSPPQLS